MIENLNDIYTYLDLILHVMNIYLYVSHSSVFPIVYYDFYMFVQIDKYDMHVNHTNSLPAIFMLSGALLNPYMF